MATYKAKVRRSRRLQGVRDQESRPLEGAAQPVSEPLTLAQQIQVREMERARQMNSGLGVTATQTSSPLGITANAGQVGGFTGANMEVPEEVRRSRVRRRRPRLEGVVELGPTEITPRAPVRRKR